MPFGDIKCDYLVYSDIICFNHANIRIIALIVDSLVLFSWDFDFLGRDRGTC